MNWLALGLGLLGLAAIAAVAYWQLVVAEGTYLGPRAVVLMYDLSAKVYERIKRYDVGAEQWFLGLPLTLALDRVPAPFVLDVATGTGRMPRALLRQRGFDGRVVGLDLSRRMLSRAVETTAQFSDRLTYIWQDARCLPFDDDVFDAVTCLEAMEFFPHPHVALREMIRVLKPNGVMLVSNRVGRDSWLLPGRHTGRGRMERLMATMALEEITPRRWQVHYDLIWSRKSSAEPLAGE